MKLISFASAIVAMMIGSFGYGLVVVGQGIVSLARAMDRKVNQLIATCEQR